MKEITDQLIDIESLRHFRFDYFEEVVSYTRSYDIALDVLHHFETVLNHYKDEITREEFIEHDIRCAYFRLWIYDKTDRWHRYVHYLNSVNETKGYDLEPYRLEIIQRKIEKEAAGKKIGNLKHKTQDELSDENIKERYEIVMERIKREINRYRF